MWLIICIVALFIIGVGIYLSNNKIDPVDYDLVDLRMQKYKGEIEKMADEIKKSNSQKSPDESQEYDIPDDASMAAELMAMANSFA